MNSIYFEGTGLEARMKGGSGVLGWNGLGLCDVRAAIDILSGMCAVMPEAKRAAPINQVLHHIADLIELEAKQEQYRRSAACQHSDTLDIDEHEFGADWIRLCKFCGAKQEKLRKLWFQQSTGGLSVREWAANIVEAAMLVHFSGNGFVPTTSGGIPWAEMTFIHNGKRYAIETIVTKVEDMGVKQEETKDGAA
jgi:hypothetical protein